ncbi:MAG: hypothetical protein R3C46_08865 [Hyphomonadaceae bacterium]
MKLKPRQLIGLGAIVIFGGILIFRLTQPSEKEIMEQRLAALPRLTTPSVEIPMPDLQYTPPPALTGDTPSLSATPATPKKDYLVLGSQDARDDLYCDGGLNAEFDDVVETAHPDDAAALLNGAQRLRGAGLAKLKAEGASEGEDWAFFTSAYAEQTQADYAAGKLRLSVATCKARANALPPDSPPPP